MDSLYEILRKYYSLTNTTPATNSLLKMAKNYESLVVEKESYRGAWQALVAELKSCPAFTRVRDADFATNLHSYRVVLPIAGAAHEGLMLCVSMAGKLQGIYFSNLHSHALVPLCSGRCTTPEQVSYYPFTKRQEELGRLVLAISHTYFPYFQKFDNIYASVPVEKVKVGEEQYDELDLFQAIFSANVHAMI